jgi:hypothetical protein
VSDSILGTLCLTTFGRSLTNDMASEYAPILKKAAAAIAARCERQRGQKDKEPA